MRRIIVKTLSPDEDDWAGLPGGERVLVAPDHPAGEVALGGADRAAGRSVQLDGEVGDAARGDVGGHVDLAATDDALVDHALAGGRVEAGIGGGGARGRQGVPSRR